MVTRCSWTLPQQFQTSKDGTIAGKRWQLGRKSGHGTKRHLLRSWLASRVSAATMVPSATQCHSSSTHDVWGQAAVRLGWVGPAADGQIEPLDGDWGCFREEMESPSCLASVQAAHHQAIQDLQGLSPVSLKALGWLNNSKTLTSQIQAFWQQQRKQLKTRQQNATKSGWPCTVSLVGKLLESNNPQALMCWQTHSIYSAITMCHCLLAGMCNLTKKISSSQENWMLSSKRTLIMVKHAIVCNYLLLG